MSSAIIITDRSDTPREKVITLRGDRLDLAVALAWKKEIAEIAKPGDPYITVEHGLPYLCTPVSGTKDTFCRERFRPSTDWAHGGPILNDHLNHAVEGIEDLLGSPWLLKVDSTQHDVLSCLMRGYVNWTTGLEEEIELPLAAP